MDAPDRPVNNNKPVKSILSLDSTTSAVETTIESSKSHKDNKILGLSNLDSVNESMTTTINQTSSTEYMNGDRGCSGSNLNRNENNVISKDEGDDDDVPHSAIEINNKYQLITIDKSNANNIQLNYSNSDDEIGSDRQLELSNKDDKTENVCGNRSEMNSVKDHSFDSGEFFFYFFFLEIWSTVYAICL